MCSRLVAFWLGAILSEPVAAQLTQRVDVGVDGAQSRFGAEVPSLPPSPIVSGDGRFIVFMSYTSNLVGGDTNGYRDLFLRDRFLGTTERIDVTTGGAQTSGSGLSFGVMVSPDGRFVAFDTRASDLVPGDTNQTWDVFVRDRRLDTTERVSVGMAGTESNENSAYPVISDDGRYVSFNSFASNLVPGDSNGTSDDFVYDRQTGTTRIVSVAMNGGPGNGPSFEVSISADGRFVAFVSAASDLVPGDTNGVRDVFLRDLQLGQTERVSVSTSGGEADRGGEEPSISADGRFVAFASVSQNLVPGDSNQVADVFVRDRVTRTTERVSIATDGSESPREAYSTAISGDGRLVAFETPASLEHGDRGYGDIYVRDRLKGTTERISLTSEGHAAHDDCTLPSISRDGHTIAFASGAEDLVSGDTNGYWDVFVHDSASAKTIALCEPGIAGVRGCPCSNPASGEGRGCDNSSGTGGATLQASGSSFLSADDLVFRTGGEVPGAPSFLVQGSAPIPQGGVYGQGIRCIGGAAKRLYTTRAVNGIAILPDFESGESPITLRSAALGNVIRAGESRWYLVQYRDPLVLGGCPATSTFNSTPTLMVQWWF